MCYPTVMVTSLFSSLSDLDVALPICHWPNRKYTPYLPVVLSFSCNFFLSGVPTPPPSSLPPSCLAAAAPGQWRSMKSRGFGQHAQTRNNRHANTANRFIYHGTVPPLPWRFATFAVLARCWKSSSEAIGCIFAHLGSLRAWPRASLARRSGCETVDGGCWEGEPRPRWASSKWSDLVSGSFPRLTDLVIQRLGGKNVIRTA